MITTEDVLEVLTNGVRPIEQSFLLKGEVCAWEHESQSIVTMLIDDNELWHACRQFLASRAQSCDNMDEVREFAKRYNWQNWNR